MDAHKPHISLPAAKKEITATGVALSTFIPAMTIGLVYGGTMHGFNPYVLALWGLFSACTASAVALYQWRQLRKEGVAANEAGVLARDSGLAVAATMAGLHLTGYGAAQMFQGLLGSINDVVTTTPLPSSTAFSKGVGYAALTLLTVKTSEKVLEPLTRLNRSLFTRSAKADAAPA